MHISVLYWFCVASAPSLVPGNLHLALNHDAGALSILQNLLLAVAIAAQAALAGHAGADLRLVGLRDVLVAAGRGRAQALLELVLRVELVVGAARVAGEVSLGRGATVLHGRRAVVAGAQVEHLAEQRPQRTDAADNDTNAVLGVTPDEDVGNGVCEALVSPA